MSLSYPDVISKLVSVSTFDEATKQEMQAAIDAQHKDTLDGLSDEEKSARPAPVDQLAATKPAMFSGGLSEDQVNAIVAKAIKQDRAERESVTVAEPATTTASQTPGNPSTVTEPAATTTSQANG